MQLTTPYDQARRSQWIDVWRSTYFYKRILVDASDKDATSVEIDGGDAIAIRRYAGANREKWRQCCVCWKSTNNRWASAIVVINHHEAALIAELALEAHHVVAGARVLIIALA